jgi:hypothetical protein
VLEEPACSTALQLNERSGATPRHWIGSLGFPIEQSQIYGNSARENCRA